LAETAVDADIRCLCLDLDGVLTDGRLFVDDAGHGARVFHVHDGLAVRWFQRLGGVVVICSGKRSEAAAARARELGIQHVIQGSQDKLSDLRSLLAQLGLGLAQTAFIGDDLPDLPLLQHCGFPIAVANAVEEVQAAARLTTRRSGGHGAVREAVEHLLRRSGRWSEVLAHYAAPESAGSD
jgi:3-deoxy-D-manno-octulosonate 8-phosphate phosphatase (KDO 8-P phosphatase)